MEMEVGLPEKVCRNCGNPVDSSDDVCRCGAPPEGGRNFCDRCANPTYEDETECTHCGKSLSSGPPAFSRTIVASTPPKDPTMIAVLSVIPLPWLGQIVMGQAAKGVTMLIVTIALLTVGIGFVLILLAAFDAYCLAKVLRDGGAISPWDFCWSVSWDDESEN